MLKVLLSVSSKAVGRAPKPGGRQLAARSIDATLRALTAIAAAMAISKPASLAGDPTTSHLHDGPTSADNGASAPTDHANHFEDATIPLAVSQTEYELDSGGEAASMVSGSTGDLDMQISDFSAALSVVLAGFVSTPQPSGAFESSDHQQVAGVSFSESANVGSSLAGFWQPAPNVASSTLISQAAPSEGSLAGSDAPAAPSGATTGAIDTVATGDVPESASFTIGIVSGVEIPPDAETGATEDSGAADSPPAEGAQHAMGRPPSSTVSYAANDSAGSLDGILVSNAAELRDALRNATGGETILLASGDYGKLWLYGPRDTFAKFSSNVTIKSADAGSLASFSSIDLREVKNLTFDRVIFDYRADLGAPAYVKPFSITSSQNISIENSIFDGDLASGTEHGDGFGTGFGLNVSNSSNITLKKSEFFDWHRAAVFGSVDKLNISENEIYHIRSDGFDFADVKDVLIERNYFHDFLAATGSGDHPDMIQFWTSGTTEPSERIVIRNNILNSAGGDETQSIFIRNQEVQVNGAGEEMFYRDIIIENNVIYNAHSHGITVGESIGVIIRNNTILHNSASGSDGLVHVPTINLVDASKSVVVENNIVPRLSLTENQERIIRNNLVVQNTDPNGQAYYGDLFTDALAGAGAGPDDLKALPGGVIEQFGVGSILTSFDTTPDSPTGYILGDGGTGLHMLTHTFDATNLFGPEGRLNLNGATAVWTFGDGQTDQGLEVAHIFEQAGQYVIAVKVTLADGRIIHLDKTILAESPVALEVPFDHGADDISQIVNQATTTGSVAFEEGIRGQAVRLNGGAITYDVSSDFLNNHEYTVQFDIKLQAGSSGGYIAYFPYSFAISAGPTKLEASVAIDGISHVVKANGLVLTDSQWHRAALTFSGADGAAVLYLDGNAVGRIDGLGGRQVGSTSQDLSIGNPFGGSFGGLIDNFSFLRGAMNADEVQASFFEMKEALGPTADDIMHAGLPGDAWYTASHPAASDDWIH